MEAVLRANGFDGLWNGDLECGCFLGDLFPCDGPCDECRPGFKSLFEDPNGGDAKVDGIGPVRFEELVPAALEELRKERRVWERKIWPQFFEAFLAGDKRYEIRQGGDVAGMGGYRLGDVFVLREWEPDLIDGETLEASPEGRYTGRTATAVITYVQRRFPGLAPGYSLLGIARLNG